MIDEITAKEEENGIIYTLDLPDSFMEKIFNIMIREQVSEEEYAVSFSNLKEFRCYMHENADGILDGMRYEGNTDVTIPEALTGEAEKTENLSLELQLDVVIREAKSQYRKWICPGLKNKTAGGRRLQLWRIASYSDAGTRIVNEDRVCVTESGNCACVTVADGVGGHGGGSTAANAVTRKLNRLFAERVLGSQKAGEILEKM